MPFNSSLHSRSLVQFLYAFEFRPQFCSTKIQKSPSLFLKWNYLSCLPCTVGTFTALTGQTTCDDCAAGKERFLTCTVWVPCTGLVVSLGFNSVWAQTCGFVCSLEYTYRRDGLVINGFSSVCVNLSHLNPFTPRTGCSTLFFRL